MNQRLRFKNLLPTLLLFSAATQANTTALQAPEIEVTNNKVDYYKVQRTIPELSTAFIDTSPAQRNDGIKVGKLSVNPAVEKALAKLGKEIAENKHDKYDSLLISQNDQLLFESYYSKGRINLPHSQASATKTYLSLAVGRAIQLGYLTMEDLHKPVINFFKGLDQKSLAHGINKITLDHTLSMRSGLRIEDETLNALDKKAKTLAAKELVKTYFSKSAPVTKATQVYKYQRSDPRITMLVLDSVVPGGAEKFIKRELIDKLGITEFDWRNNFGLPEGNYSAMMKSRDMLKWGKLMKDKGLWNKERLIPAAFIKQATSKIAIPHSKNYDFTNFDYGYYIWQTDMTVGNQSYRCNMAWGGGGQYVIAFDELNLVIAVTARARGVEDKTLTLVEERILPLFT